MPRESRSVRIRCSCEQAFELIHDYHRRLEWDTLLRKAELLDGAQRAGKGVRSVCAAKWIVGGIAIESEYVSFDPPRVAAVKMVNRPMFFDSFAATILHQQVSEEESRVTYIYNFRARPQWLARALEPAMNYFLRREITIRLSALKSFLESRERP